MIARLWHGWTTTENANAYEQLLRAEVLPGIHRIDGYRGAYLLRRDAEDGGEFATLTLWDSMDAVRAFAGDDAERAHYRPAALEFLVDPEPFAVHYEVLPGPAAPLPNEARQPRGPGEHRG